MALQPASATDTFVWLGKTLEGWPLLLLLLVALCPIAILLGPLLHKKLTSQFVIGAIFAVIAAWMVRIAGRPN